MNLRRLIRLCLFVSSAIRLQRLDPCGTQSRTKSASHHKGHRHPRNQRAAEPGAALLPLSKQLSIKLFLLVHLQGYKISCLPGSGHGPGQERRVQGHWAGDMRADTEAVLEFGRDG